MEINQPLDSEISSLDVPTESKAYLLGAAKWARFIAISGFIFMVFFVFVIVVAGGAMATMGFDEFDLGFGSGTFGAVVFIYVVVMSALMFFPNYYLYKFSSRIITAINSSSTLDLTDGLKNLKSTFKFYGYMILIWIGLFVILLLVNFLTLNN